jgi:hypothetical protein
MAFGQPTKENQPVNPSPKMEPYDIHVMPDKFHQYLKVKSKGSASKFLMIFAVVLFVVVILGIGGYFLYLQMNQSSQNTNVANQNIPAVANQNLNIENLNVPENLNAIENVNLNENLNVNGNINAILNENLNINGNENINAPIGVISYSSSLDSDSDKLTDVEENLYQTEIRTADTDGDGYFDGEEVINDYNPKMAGNARLETSGLVNKYSNPVYNYEIFYPTSWLARPEDQSLKVVLFMTSTEEFMKISIEDNPDKTDIVSWYLKMSPGSDLNLTAKVMTKNSLEALVSPDKLTYYILDPNTLDKVYVISYNIGTLKQVNFLSTFQMMINSFKVIKPSL